MWVNTWYIKMTDVTIYCDSMVNMSICYAWCDTTNTILIEIMFNPQTP